MDNPHDSHARNEPPSEPVTGSGSAPVPLDSVSDSRGPDAQGPESEFDPLAHTVRIGDEVSAVAIRGGRPSRRKLPLPDDIVGFEILEILGRGGMGIVYKARQLSLNRLTAIKMILGGEHIDDGHVARFLAEAEVVATLQHPNVIQIYECSRREDRPYLVLEYVAGGSLASRLRRGALPPAAAVRLLEQLAAGVDAAHAQGIIHRDLKPGNILLSVTPGSPPVDPSTGPGSHPSGPQSSGSSPSGKTPSPDALPDWEHVVPKISDFGLAKRADVDNDLTRTGMIVGTPSYMAPEQAGRTGVGPATDVYALGAILYECLVGRPPFKAADPLNTLTQVMSEEPVAPRQLDPGISRDLETVTLKCLEKEPSQRYPSARALADDLRRVRLGEPVLARPVGSEERFRRWCRRYPAVAMLSGVSLLLLVLLVAAAWLGTDSYLKARQAATLAQLDLDLARGEALRQEKLARGTIAAAQLAEKQALRDREAADDAKADLLRERHEAEEVRNGLKRLAEANAGNTGLLLQSYLNQAPARRAYGLMGQRTECLRILKAAAVLRNDPVIRSEAVAALALYDFARTTVPRDEIDWPPLPPRNKDGALHEPTGRQAIVQPGGRKVLVLDEDGRTIAEVVHPAPVSPLAWSPDGRFLICACDDTLAYVWRVPEGRLQSILEGHQSALSRVYPHPTRPLVLTVGFDATARLWDLITGRPLVKRGDSGIYGPFSKDGRFLWGTIKEGPPTTPPWELIGGDECRILHHGEVGYRPFRDPPPPGPWEVDFSPDGRLLAAVGQDGVRIRRVADGLELKFLPAGAGRGLKFLPDGRLCTSGKEVRLWEFEVSAGELPTVRVVSNRLLSGTEEGMPARRPVGVSADGRLLVLGDGQRGMLLLRPAAADRPPSEDGPPTTFPQAICAFAAIDPSGTLVASGTWASEPLDPVRVRRVADGTVLWEDMDSRYGSLTFSPDGRRLLLGRKNGYRLVEAADGKLVWELPRQTNLPGPAAFSPDGRLVALMTDNFTLRLVDAATGRERTALPPREPSLVAGLRFSPDGRLLAVATEHQTVLLWDLGLVRERLRELNLDWDDAPESAPPPARGPPATAPVTDPSSAPNPETSTVPAPADRP